MTPKNSLSSMYGPYLSPEENSELQPDGYSQDPLGKQSCANTVSNTIRAVKNVIPRV